MQSQPDPQPTDRLTGGRGGRRQCWASLRGWLAAAVYQLCDRGHAGPPLLTPAFSSLRGGRVL